MQEDVWECHKAIFLLECEKYAEVGVMPDEDNILSIGISFAESWQMGHLSHNGNIVDIDLLIGLPLDFEALNNFYKEAKTRRKIVKISKLIGEKN